MRQPATTPGSPRFWSEGDIAVQKKIHRKITNEVINLNASVDPILSAAGSGPLNAAWWVEFWAYFFISIGLLAYDCDMVLKQNLESIFVQNKTVVVFDHPFLQTIHCATLAIRSFWMIPDGRTTQKRATKQKDPREHQSESRIINFVSRKSARFIIIRRATCGRFGSCIAGEEVIAGWRPQQMFNKFLTLILLFFH